MPQIAIIQSTTPQTTPQAPPSNNDSQGFSPHLEKAISNRNDQPSTEKNKISENQDVHQTATTHTQENSDTDSSKASQETAEDKAGTGTIKQTAEQITLETEGQIDNFEAPMANQQLNTLSQLFDFLSNNSTKTNEDTGGDEVLLSDKAQQNLGEERRPSTLLEENLGLSKAGNGFSTVYAPLAAKPEQNAFLQQLQKIIDNSDESGTPLITVTGNTFKEQPEGQSRFLNIQTVLPSEILGNESPPPVVAFSDFSEFDIDGSLLPSLNSSELPEEKANQSLSTMRRTIQQQYFEEKIVPKIDTEDQASSEGALQNNSFSPKGSDNIVEKNVSGLIQDQNNMLTQSISPSQEGQKTSATHALQPVTLPSGTIVQQEEVVRQIIERFQIARRDFDTRVNIQLHPAELGEVQISLSVKEGAVRANVVASSQYAQEIIEKNMGKLRTVLENQGFTIDQIAVTSKSDTAGDFNLLDKQLFSKNDYTPPTPKKTHNAGDLFVEEDFALHKHPSGNEINLNI
jgi:flagellar hook-length control protein FliK